MALFTDIEAHVDTLRRLLGVPGEADVTGPALVPALDGLDDERIVAVITEATAAVRGLESVRAAAGGIVAARSERDAGHSGLAQRRGHRSPVALIQELTGATRADASVQVRTGRALLEGTVPIDPPSSEVGGPAAEGGASGPWHAPIGDALLAGTITVAQHDAILRGLGDPPVITADPDAPDDPERAAAITAAAAEIVNAWTVAAGQLVEEAGCRTVEELASAARTVRDVLDPDGAEQRFQRRFERRSFRVWVDGDGVRHGSFVFDDEGALWVRTIMDAALAPRRGVRFVDDAECARADALVEDPRTTDQLAYDLMIDLLRAGALADAASVFGARQAGVRLLVTPNALDAAERGEPSTGQTQDDGAAVPAWLAARHACSAGIRSCTVDGGGNPLDLGREARLFSPQQKLVLAVRDGGCRWPGCDRPAHYCEAHHIDGWSAGGRTDVDRGILLCRFHHGALHHGGWWITRCGKDDFLLHGPGSRAPIRLTARLSRHYLFRTAAPPPRFRARPAPAA